MHKSKKRDEEEGSLESRVMGLLASLFFSVPTAMLIWFGVNKELGFLDGFIGTEYLWLSIAVFAAIAFIAPTVFPSVLGYIWRWFLKLWGW